jgi:GT2 family glycosyltransferase
MDSDDYAPPDRFAAQWDFLRTHPAIDVLGGTQLEFAHDPSVVQRMKLTPETHERIVRSLKWRNVISHASLVVRTDALNAVGRYHEVRLLEDYDLLLRLAAAGHRFHALQEPMVYARVDDALRVRRGGIRYASTEVRFRFDAYRRGDISALNLVLSVPCYIAYRLSPIRLKRIAASFVRVRVAAPA